jgi:hypothetical protein
MAIICSMGIVYTVTVLRLNNTNPTIYVLFGESVILKTAVTMFHQINLGSICLNIYLEKSVFCLKFEICFRFEIGSFHYMQIYMHPFKYMMMMITSFWRWYSNVDLSILLIIYVKTLSLSVCSYDFSQLVLTILAIFMDNHPYSNVNIIHVRVYCFNERMNELFFWVGRTQFPKTG